MTNKQECCRVLFSPNVVLIKKWLDGCRQFLCGNPAKGSPKSSKEDNYTPLIFPKRLACHFRLVDHYNCTF